MSELSLAPWSTLSGLHGPIEGLGFNPVDTRVQQSPAEWLRGYALTPSYTIMKR